MPTCFCCIQTIDACYNGLLARFDGKHDAHMTFAVRNAIEALYPEAIDILTDASHEIHEVSRGFPAFPVFGPANPNSRVVLAVADMPGLPTGFVQKTCCQNCATPHHVVILGLQLLRIHEYLLGVAGECIEVLPEAGQVRTRVHDIESNWDGVSDENVTALRQLLADCRSGTAARPALAPFVFKSASGHRMAMIRAAGLAWLAAHELAHTSEKNSLIPSASWTAFSDPAYAKEEYEADQAALRILMHRSVMKAPLDHEERFTLFAGCELLLHTLDVVQAAAEGALADRHNRKSSQEPLSLTSRFKLLAPLMTTYGELFANQIYRDWRLPYLCGVEIAIRRVIRIPQDHMLENLDAEAIKREIDPQLSDMQADDAAIRLLLAQRVLPEARFAEPPPFWTNVREHFRLFLCTKDERYERVREDFRQRGREATAGLVGLLAGTIAATIGGGVLLTTLVPFVALLLYTAMNLGVNAYCAGQTRG